MLKSYKSSLNLNSYKLDTRGYEEKIKQLIAESAEVKSLLGHSRSKQSQLLEELKSTKLEVNTLRNMMKNEFVVHQNKCKNCAAYSKQSIDKLISDLDEQRAKCAEFRKMYENEVENKKKLTDYYQKKLHNLLRDKDLLVKKYEEKMRYLSSHTITSQNIDSSTSIHNHLYSTPKTQQEIQPLPIDKSIQKSSKNLPPTSPRHQPQPQPQTQPLSLSKPPASPRSIPVKPTTSYPQSQGKISSSQSVNLLIQPIVEKLTKMQISFDELKAIPQIQRFAQTPAPPKNRFIKLLRDFPFECEDDDLIEEVYNYILQYFRSSSIDYNGENVVNFLTNAMEGQS